MIELNNIHKSFSGHEVLKGVSFKVEKGEILVLIGMSGYGKSVILKHVVGLLKPDKGTVKVDGLEVNSLKKNALADLRSRIGFLFQGGALFESMTVYDNVAFPLREKARLDRTVIEKKVLNVIDQVGLSGAENKYPSQLSGGMQKRAALARELVWEPEIMIFDEPTTGLDPIIGHAILNLIEEMHKRMHFTGIIITHELSRVFKIVNKVAMLHEGIIIETGSPEEMLSSKNSLVRQFLSGDTEGPISFR
ncbi:MAG: ATP-binding cassette domain-containing protein [Deltaproteobacteria bacterium]|nr:ATP-binding cassette domain-containing protein [Deltaproteobacteria bacterium]